MSSGKVSAQPIADKPAGFFKKTSQRISKSFKVPSNPVSSSQKQQSQPPQLGPLAARVKADIAEAEALRAEEGVKEDAEDIDEEPIAAQDEPVVEGEDEEADETVIVDDDDEEPLTTEKPLEEKEDEEAAKPESSEEPVEEPIEEPIEEAVEETVEEPIAPSTPVAEEEEVAAETEEAPLIDSSKDLEPLQVSPMAAPPIAIPENIKTKPKLVGKYHENMKIASQVLNKNKVVNAGRRIDLGAGLILTEDQIYELAKKKLEPVMGQIDERVAENLKRDAEAAAKVEEGIKIRDEGVVASQLAAYKACVDNETAIVQKTHDDAIAALDLKDSTSKQQTEDHVQQETEGIETDATDAEKAETDAIELHDSQKENLIATVADLKETKTKELESTKAKQIEETELAEKLDTEGQSFSSKADDLEKEVAEKKAALEARIKQVEALISTKTEKKESIRAVTKKRKTADRSFGIISGKHALLASNVAVLGGQVGLMNSRVAAHDTKINHFNTTGKEALQSKKVEATDAKTSWGEEMKQMRLEEAQKQERLKIEAEEERKRIAQEKLEEEERLAKEKEEEILQKKKEEEEAIALHEEEIARAKKLKELREEKLQLEKEEAAAAAAAAAKESESKKSLGLGAVVGGLGVAAGAATGAAAGAIIAASSNAASTATSAMTSTGEAVSKSIDPFTDFSADKGEIHVIEEEKEEIPSTTTDEGYTPIPTATTSGSISNVPSTPVRRRSMVDEALANMTPDQIKRMNTPLKDLYPKEKESPIGTPVAESGSLSRKNSSRSRSGSLSLFKRKSRNNSLKQSASEAAAAAVATKKASLASPTKKVSEDIQSKDVDLGATQSIGEAKKVPIASHDSAERVNTKQSVDSVDDDSLSDPTTAKPVFTETIGKPETTAAATEDPSQYDDDEFVEVSTLETIDSAEYRAHKDDPNYMIIKK